MPVIGGVPNFSGVTAGVSSINSVAGAANITSPDASITVTPNGQNIEIETAGGGGAPGSPDLSIQGNSGGDFVGIPGSAFDATDGFVTLTPTGGAYGLTINGEANEQASLLLSKLNGGAGLSTDIEDTNGSNGDGVTAINVQAYESDGIGSGARITAIFGFAALQPNGGDSNISTDTARAGQFGVFGGADGNPAELTDIYCSGNGVKATFTAGIVAGVRISDKNANSAPATINAGLWVEDQTPGTGVCAIQTGKGPNSFGDTVEFAEVAFADLPSSPILGQVIIVSDAIVTVPGTTIIIGGGTDVVLAIRGTSDWLVMIQL